MGKPKFVQKYRPKQKFNVRHETSLNISNHIQLKIIMEFHEHKNLIL